MTAPVALSQMQPVICLLPTLEVLPAVEDPQVPLLKLVIASISVLLGSCWKVLGDDCLNAPKHHPLCDYY